MSVLPPELSKHMCLLSKDQHSSYFQLPSAVTDDDYRGLKAKLSVCALQPALCSLLSAACSLLNTVSQIITEHFVALKDAINPNNLSVWIRVLLKNEASL